MFVMFDLKPNANRVALPRHSFLRFLALHEPSPSIKPKRHKSAGFTMLELLVVIALLGVLTLAGTTLLIDDGDWKRQDETEARWDAIRKAIIGEPNLNLNGSPYVAGFVADMGRLPQSISELIEQNVSFDSDGDFLDDYAV